jgi:hypothetical protein
MSQYRTLNRAVWAKVESTPGVDASPVAGTNAVLVENPNSNLNLNTFDTNEVTGALDRKAPIPSTGNAGFSGRVYLHGSGAAGTTLPEVDPFLKACGFSPTAFSADVTGTAQAGASGTITLASGASASNNFYRGCVIITTGGTGSGQTRQIRSYVGSTKVATVTPAWTVTPDATTTYAVKACHIYKQVSSSIPTITIYEHLTRTDGGDSKLRAQVGAAGTMTFAAQVGTGCYFDFTMTGSLVQPTDVTPPSASTYQSTRPIAFVDAITCALDGTSIALDNFSFDAGNEVSQINDPRADYGLGVAGIVRRGAGGTFRAPMELESVRDVFSSWKNGTEAVLSLIWGSTAGNRFAVLSDHMVYSAVSDADVSGFLYAETPFRCNQPNDSFMITYW